MRRVSVFLVLLFLVSGCAARSVTPKIDAGTVNVNGVDIAYRMQGAGEPLLLVMGYAGTMDAWDPALVASLAKSNRVILFDNRNMGCSGTSPDPVSMELMARDAIGLLKGLGIGRAHVLGWSMGSVIAQEMALMDPDAVGKVVLYGTTCSADAISKAVRKFDGLTPKQVAALLFPKPWVKNHPDIYSRLPSPANPATPEAIMRQRKAILDWPGSCGRLAALDKAVLVIEGGMDDITPVAGAMEVVAEIPGAWVARFKGGGHWLMYQAPEGMARTVKAFLATDQDLLR